MRENNSKSITLNETGTSQEGPAGSASTGRSSRIKHDSRGNAVWDWGVTTGVFAAIKSDELLSRLENPTLTLEGDSGHAGIGDWAGDPYNRR